MYEELYAPLPDINAYLERIGLKDANPEPTAMWLEKLVHGQLLHVPFDAMDVWGKGDCPSLAVNDLFDKIVLRRRGGYCFELNSLFCALLKAVGYDAYTVIVHLMGGRAFISPPAHCAIVCMIDGEKYFCDVGYGGPVPDGAVKFDGEVYHGYRIVKNGDYTALELAEEESFKCVMLFNDIPALPVDLMPLNYYVSQRPDSGFRNRLNLNLRLEDGSASVQNRIFKFRSGEERIERELQSLNELREILPRYFGIPADDPTYKEFG